MDVESAYDEVEDYWPHLPWVINTAQVQDMCILEESFCE